MSLERIELNFATTTRRPSRVGLVLAALGAVALVLGGLAFARAWAGHAERLRAAALTVAPDSRATAPVPVSLPLTSTELALERQVLSVTRALQTPWSELLAALEGAASPSVALLSVEPAAAQETVRLTAQARDPQAMLNYLAVLQADRRLSRVVLIAHEPEPGISS